MLTAQKRKKSFDALDLSIMRQYLQPLIPTLAAKTLANSVFGHENEEEWWAEQDRVKHIVETLQQMEVAAYQEDDLKAKILKEQMVPF